jgi:prepilin-type N-terminal cleavage/methylation domain-containing protein
MQKGFTIAELIVVIAIIAVLAAIVLVNVNNYQNNFNYNYEICSESKECYYINDYQENNSCVKFEGIKICGNYIIEELKKEN